MEDRFEGVLGDQPRGRVNYQATKPGEIEFHVLAEVEWVRDDPNRLAHVDPDEVAEAVDREEQYGHWYAHRDWREAENEAQELADRLFARHPDRPGLRKRAMGYLCAYQDQTGHDIRPVGSDWTNYQPRK